MFELSGVENGGIEPKMRTVALIGPEISMFEQFYQFGLFKTLLDTNRPNFETPDKMNRTLLGNSFDSSMSASNAVF